MAYSYHENTIRISIKKEITDPPDILTPDSIVEYIDTNSSVYGKMFPSANIIHELEHQRRGSDHTGGSHGENTINGKTLTFDECANYFYDEALKKNLIGKIMSL